MKNPKGMPKELWGLWKIQYAPREKWIERRLGKQAMTKYFKLAYTKKMHLIDTLESQGYFEK